MKKIKFNFKNLFFLIILGLFTFNLGLKAIPRLTHNTRQSPTSRERSIKRRFQVTYHRLLNDKYSLLAALLPLAETGSPCLSNEEIKQTIQNLLKKDINNDLKQKIKQEVRIALNSNELKTEIIDLLRTEYESLLGPHVNDFIEKAKKTFLNDKLLNKLLNYGKLNLHNRIPTFITYLEGTDEFNECEESVDAIDQTIFDDIFLQKIIVDIFSKFTAITELDLSSNYLIEIPTYIDKLTHLEKLDLSNNQILPTNLNTQAITNLRKLKFFNLENDYEEEEFDDKEDFPATIGHLFKDENRVFYTIKKEFVKKSIVNEITKLLVACKYEIFLFFKKNNTTDTDQMLSQKTDAFLRKIQDIFCNKRLLEELVQLKSLNLKQKIPYTGIININNIRLEQFIFNQFIFNQIIIGIYSRWIPIFNLDLSSNSLVSVPQNLHLLKNLERCDLSGNLIENINAYQIEQLECLKYLNLTNLFDQITTFGCSDNFPNQISHLTKDDNESIYRFIK